MFLTDIFTNLVVASEEDISETDDFYWVYNTGYSKNLFRLYRFRLKDGYEVGWCTYVDGKGYTTIPKPPPEADEQTKKAIEEKIKEINSKCEDTIVHGVDYNGQHYSLTSYDQINMSIWADRAKSGNSVPYHADGDDCRIYTPEEFLGLVGVATLHIVYNQTYANQLKKQVADMIYKDQVDAVYYGTPLVEERQKKLDEIMRKTADDLGVAL